MRILMKIPRCTTAALLACAAVLSAGPEGALLFNVSRFDRLVKILTEEGVTGGGEGQHIGSRRQVFIDGRFLQKSQNVELVMHPAKKTGEFTIEPEHPWERGGIGPYGSVLKTGGTYQMWYHAMDTVDWDTGQGRGCVCYARSGDGIRWEKPPLGVAEYDGSRANNIVLGHGAGGVRIGQAGGTVFLDPTAPPDQRYRMLKRVDEVGSGNHIFSSPDGIHWTLTHRGVLTARPQKRGHHLDSQNIIFWDERIRKYVAYGRKNMRRDGSQGRAILRGEAEALDGFPVAQDMPVVLGPDRSDLFHGATAVVDYYTNATVAYGAAQDAYYMFPTAYYHYVPRALREFSGACPTNAGPIHTQFAASRDGITWHRFGRRPFVDLGMRGEFDWASCRVMHGVVSDRSGRDLYFYYWGSDRLHGWDRDVRNKRLLSKAGLGATKDIAVLSRLVVRRDGFVSVRAPYTGGEFTTPPVRFDGTVLLLNVDTSATGIVQVELRDAADRPLPGYRLEDCDRIHTANETDRVVTWKGKGDVRRLAGAAVRIRFVMRDADLYAFRFRP